MLPGIGGAELVIVAIVALVVVGPKDLPLLMRKVGQFMARLRAMANDFRASFDEMARQSELDELRKEVEALRSNQMQPIADEIAQPMRELGRDIEADLRAHPAPEWAPEYLTPSEEPDRLPHVEETTAPKSRRTRAPKAAGEPVSASATVRKPRQKAAVEAAPAAAADAPKPARRSPRKRS